LAGRARRLDQAAAVRGDELLEERTLPYEFEAVGRVLRRWPRVQCCYEAGPTGFGLYRHLIRQGDGIEAIHPNDLLLDSTTRSRSREFPVSPPLSAPPNRERRLFSKRTTVRGYETGT
jgi:hypothetical protein